MNFEKELVGQFYGESNQYEIISYGIDEAFKSKQKIYLVKCHLCALDPELFGEAIFKTRMAEMKNGNKPCGCSPNFRCNFEQNIVRCKRLNNPMVTFEGYFGEYIGGQTRININCSSHGFMENAMTTSHWLSCKKTQCKYCAIENMRHDDGLHIADFRASGKFHKDTVFNRIANADSQKWEGTCGGCGEYFSGLSANFKRGIKLCGCKNIGYLTQNLAYIILIKDNEAELGVKYGITSNIKNRVGHINLSTVYDCELIDLYEFETVSLCKQAEKECKLSLASGIFNSTDFRSGKTETTYCYNTDKIKEIYKSFGGFSIFGRSDINMLESLEGCELNSVILSEDKESIVFRSSEGYLHFFGGSVTSVTGVNVFDQKYGKGDMKVLGVIFYKDTYKILGEDDMEIKIKAENGLTYQGKVLESVLKNTASYSQVVEDF